MATIDALFKPVTSAKSDSLLLTAQVIHERSFEDESQSHNKEVSKVSGKRNRGECNMKSSAKKRKVENLNDSIEDFNLTPKPTKKSGKIGSKVSERRPKAVVEDGKIQSVSNTTDKLKDASKEVTEISYSDFLVAQDDTVGLPQSQNLEPVVSYDNTLDSRPPINLVGANNNVPVKKNQNKTIQNFLKWNSKAETKVEHADIDDSPQTEEHICDELNVKSISSFFSKASEMTMARKLPVSPSEITVKADVHKEPTSKVFNIFDFKKRRSGLEKDLSPQSCENSNSASNTKQASNVIVEEMDSEIRITGTFPVTPVKKRKSRPPAKPMVTSAEPKPIVVGVACENHVTSDSGTGRDGPWEDKTDVTEIASRNDKTEVECARREKLSAQLQSLDKIKLDSNHASQQATLDFSAKGMNINKTLPAVRKEVKENDILTSDPICGETTSKKRLAKKSSTSCKTKKRQATNENQKTGRHNLVSHQPRSLKRKKDLRESSEEEDGVFVATLVKTPVGKKSKMPLKMKITRVRGRENTDQLKLSRAQQLVLKAKSKTKRASQDLNKSRLEKHIKQRTLPVVQAKEKLTRKKGTRLADVERLPEQGLRRSHRQSAHNATCAISLGFEEVAPARDRKTKKKVVVEVSFDEDDGTVQVHATKKANMLSKSPAPSSKNKGKALKLAPLFMKKTVEPKASESGSDCEVVAMETTPVDAEALRVKRSFLLSGVPQALKKQQAGVESLSLSQYSPWPTVSHVQQKQTLNPDHPLEGPSSKIKAYPADKDGTGGFCSVDVWSLPSDVAVPRLLPASCVAVGTSIKWAWSSLNQMDKQCYVARILERTAVNPYEGEVLDVLLAEIRAYNPGFPVSRMYKTLHAKAHPQPVTNVSAAAQNVKKVGRKRKTRKNAEVDKPPNPVPEIDGLHWTEKYAPVNSNEMFSNVGPARRVRTWLAEWKKKTDMEFRKQVKQEIKQARRSGDTKEQIKKKLQDMFDSEDANDFDFEIDDSEKGSDSEEEDGLCNTMLVTGPHGCGKTALISSLAQELGYKVFEVNASSRRSGRHVLTELQEATQSHQVAKKHTDSGADPMITAKAPSPIKAKKQGQSAIASMFKKAPVPQEKKGEKKASKGQARMNSDKLKHPVATGGEPTVARKEGEGQRKALKLTSVSLILFEETDVVLEEDKGFWSAVHTFMATTKRPIILTASEPGFAEKFGRKLEKISMKPPQLNHLASYLQLVCLVEGFRTHREDLCSLVEWLTSDLRQCCLTLQWLLHSGGAACKISKSVLGKAKSLPSKEETVCIDDKLTSLPVGGEIEKSSDVKCNSDEDFQPVVRRRTRQSQPVINDDSSEDGYSGNCTMYSLQKQDAIPDDKIAAPDEVPGPAGEDVPQQEASGIISQTIQEESQSVQLVELMSASVAPPMHRISFSSLLGKGMNLNSDVSFLQAMNQSIQDSPLQLLDMVTQCRSLKRELLYTNMVFLLPLPKAVVPYNMYTSGSAPASTRSRIKQMSDMFDSENSDDCSEKKQTEIEVGSSDSSLIDGNRKKVEPVSTKQDGVASDALGAISELYDTISLADIISTTGSDSRDHVSRDDNSLNFGKLLTGDSDELCSHPCTRVTFSSMHDCGIAMELLQLHKTDKLLQDKLRLLDGCSTPDDVDNMTLPVDIMRQVPSFVREDRLQASSGHKSLQAMRQAAENLPLSTRGHSRSVSCDYLPTIRSIFQSEQIRMTSGRKRRFLHYLGPLVQDLKQSTIDVLCSAF